MREKKYCMICGHRIIDAPFHTRTLSFTDGGSLVVHFYQGDATETLCFGHPSQQEQGHPSCTLHIHEVPQVFQNAFRDGELEL
jgi:hypothetical protein